MIHFLFGHRNNRRRNYEGPVLNVLNLDYVKNDVDVSFVQENVSPDDVTIILPGRNYNENLDVILQRWIGSTTLVLTRNLTISKNTFKLNLFSLDANSAGNVIRKLLSAEHFLSEKSNITMFFQQTPPRTTVSPDGTNFTFIGPDGTLGEILAKSFQLTPILCTDIGLTYPDYEEWLDEPTIASRIHFRLFYKKTLTKNGVKVFNMSLSDEMDLHMSAFPVMDRSAVEQRKFKTENLYPHERDCLVIMVPKQSNLEHFLEKIIKNSDILSIFIALILFAIVRIIIEKCNWKKWLTIFIKTLGIFLNQEQIRNTTDVEVAWDMNLRGFSVLATIALSVIIYTNLVNQQPVEIDTIDDLIASNLTIYAPDFLQNDTSFVSNLKPSLHQKMNYKSINEINFDVVTRRKFNYAYIFTDGAAEYIDMLLHSYISNEKSYKRTIRIMKEKLNCRLTSYRIAKTSRLKEYVNHFIRRFIESGLYDRHLEWIRQLNKDVFLVNKYRTTSKDPIVLSMEVVVGIFALYIIIFVQQDYRLINFWSGGEENELTNNMIKIASDSLQPFSHFVFGHRNNRRRNYEGPVLNVLNLDYVKNDVDVSFVQENVLPDDVTIILPGRNYDENGDVILQRWIDSTTLVLTRNLTISKNTFKLNLFSFDANSTGNVIRKLLSAEHFLSEKSNITMFFQYTPPRTTVSPNGTNFTFIGPDGTLGEILAKSFKLTPILCTDIGLTYPEYKEWLDDPTIASRIHFRLFYQKTLTKNGVKVFNMSLSDEMDLQMSAFPVKDRSAIEQRKLKTEHLYPHERDCLVIMVPKQSNLKNFLEKIMKNSDILSIFLALILFAIVRIIIEKSTWKQWITIFIKTLGVFLSQEEIRNANNVEVAWDMNLRGFSLFATITLSCIIYTNLVNQQPVEIDTIDDLIASNLTIHAPDFLQNDTSFMSNLKPNLLQKMNFKSVNEIYLDVVGRRKFNNAYIFTDGAAEYIDMLLHTYTDEKSYKRTVRIMKEALEI
ncbi:hypothetical protein Bhyg_16545 [Pseudolycoriella hygida]|uniref:Uncharacterized protein n=1 Tax=Pseudolycoriella hygida TaxID=35572 RepID=A0A9Q0MJ68_9DIPT|nr:hypothetical protein Bhyg_16545 [Pseudolycoriella hygida]